VCSIASNYGHGPAGADVRLKEKKSCGGTNCGIEKWRIKKEFNHGWTPMDCIIRVYPCSSVVKINKHFNANEPEKI